MMRRALPWISMVSGLILAGYGAAYLVADDMLPASLTTARAVGAVTIGLGLVLLIASIGSLAPERAPPAPAAAPRAAPAPAPVRPRSDFPWSGAPQPETAPASDPLEDVRRRIAQLKVRYGLGEMSPEAYKRLMGDLETEETNLERQRGR